MSKHKVFISYHHKDERFRMEFEHLFGDLFINKAVNKNEINVDNGDGYIKRIIREEYISDSSVVVVLIGDETYSRKHVDWEIYAGLYKNAGLVGIFLPTNINFTNKFYPDCVPLRLLDNHKSNYAILDNWTSNRKTIKNLIEIAFENKNNSDNIDNSRNQMKCNTIKHVNCKRC